jgi:hypothetical protein
MFRSQRILEFGNFQTPDLQDCKRFPLMVSVMSRLRLKTCFTILTITFYRLKHRVFLSVNIKYSNKVLSQSSGLECCRWAWPGLAWPWPWSCSALPCPAMPCRALLCPSLACRALSCPSLPCLAVTCPAQPCLALSCRALPCPDVSCRALSIYLSIY